VLQLCSLGEVRESFQGLAVNYELDSFLGMGYLRVYAYNRASRIETRHPHHEAIEMGLQSAHLVELLLNPDSRPPDILSVFRTSGSHHP
jgi:hypothetical protein